MDAIQKILDAHRRKFGMDIAVVDDSGYVGFAAAASRIDEVYMDSAKSMVENVLKKRGPYFIRRLDILDHGNEQSFSIGNDWIDETNVKDFAPLLGRLKPAFHASGFVHLQHCNIGQNKTVLVELAKIWDVAVYAGTGTHNPVYRINFGDYVRADPDGSVRPAGRPNEDWHVRSAPVHGPIPSEPMELSYSMTAHDDPPPPPPKPKLMRVKR